jgi:hypothetical protein
VFASSEKAGVRRQSKPPKRAALSIRAAPPRARRKAACARRGGSRRSAASRALRAQPSRLGSVPDARRRRRPHFEALVWWTTARRAARAVVRHDAEPDGPRAAFRTRRRGFTPPGWPPAAAEAVVSWRGDAAS